MYLKHENPSSALQTSGVRFSCVLREMLYKKKIRDCQIPIYQKVPGSIK